MSSNTLLFGWNRSLPGRESLSQQHFGQFYEYLGGLQSSGAIDSFDTVFLEPHGGDLNGFFLIRGDANSLDSLVGSDDWADHMTRAGMHLDRPGYVRGFTGDMIMDRMKRWSSHIPD